MKFIKDIRDGDQLCDIYFCKEKKELKSRTDKPYYSLILQDKTGSLDGKVWDINSNGIEDFESGDFIYIQGNVSTYVGTLQARILRARKCTENEFNMSDYILTSKYNIDGMYEELLNILSTVQFSYYKTLLNNIFLDTKIANSFKLHSAAKSVHHSFVGGLLEHSLSVTKICDFLASHYKILNRDLLITAAPLHDIGKLFELGTFPNTDYTDSGQLLGHIYIGANFINKKIDEINDFPKRQADELIHCILSHHGSLEYGSPKLPALMEAFALSIADNMDAKLEAFTEIIEGNMDNKEWLGYNRMFETNIRVATRNRERDA